jgi:DNA-binding NarL/FixJ family response regulator
VSKITVLLADDHAMVRQGLRALLEAEEDMSVVDIAMPLLNGLGATRQISRECPKCRVLILSSHTAEEYVEQLAAAGATGYLLKQTAARELVAGIREANKGNAFFSPGISKRLLEQYQSSFHRPRGKRTDFKLTSREHEILQLIAEGHTNKQIAAQLCISTKTVEKHRLQLMKKLDIHEIAGLTRYAIDKGVIEASTGAARGVRTFPSPTGGKMGERQAMKGEEW